MYKRNRYSAELTYAHQARAVQATEALPPEITITPIGKVELGVEGSDEYVLLTRKDDDLDEDFARDWLLRRVYRESIHPGGYYCTAVTIVPKPYRGNECIAIIEHRYDV